jgi:RHS repeat-associated protein
LARTILGQQQVQGVDYAYTLQGWLKGVNSMALDTARDMGKDGGLTARDAYGYQLNYFTGDYLPINASRNPFPGHSAYIGAAYRPLYNGNISSMAVNIGKLNQPQLYNYEYDQLNRLVSMQAWRGFTSSTNSWTGMTATADHQESITYDGNGNILTYLRNGNTSASKPLGMDNLSYFYNDSAGIRRNNRLRHVTDAVAAANYTEDIDGQAVDNYGYDAIGNLTRDNAEKISAITWNVYGKISQITKTASTVVGDLQLIRYGYDASGNRIRKTVYYNQDATNYRAAHTWYVRDASGNVMATYISAGLMPKTSTRDTTSKVPLYLSELHMYGSSRLGIWSRNVNMDVLPTGGGTVRLLGTAGIDTFNRGNKFFELSNHLGNVLVTVSDRKFGQSPVNNLYTSFTADVVSATDYAPFGMQMVGRTFDAAGSPAYRYGFNGKENDSEVKGEGNQQDYGMRIYDPRLGKFLSVDPLTKEYPFLTPYQFSSNRPIDGVDLDGMEYVKTIPQFEKSGGLLDYVTEIDNAAIRLINLPLTTWNSAVANYQSLKRETWKKDMKSDLSLMGEGIKATAIQFYHEPIRTLVSPEAVGVYAEAFIGGKVFSTIPKAGNLLKTTKNSKTSNVTPIAEKKFTVAYGDQQVPIFRGGGDFTLKPGEYKVTPNGKYPARGLSLDANPNNLENYGGAFEIKKIPNELEIIHTPSARNPKHYDIIPKNTKISESEFQTLLNKIEVKPIKN